MLTEAEKLHPDNPVMSYYLGWHYFRNGNQEAAIDEWEGYLIKYPDTPWSDVIQQQLTLIKVNQSAAYARITAKQDPMTLSHKINPNRITVFNFQDRSFTRFDGLSKGLADLIIHDLSKIQKLKVVSRLRMQSLVHEIQVGESAIADRDSARRISTLLLAGYAVWGEFTDTSQTNLNVLVHVTETSQGTEIAEFNVKGSVDNLGILEKHIVSEILRCLNLNKNNIPPQALESMKRNFFTDSNAFMVYSKGLEYFDKRAFSQAKEAFKNAAEMDGKFYLARQAAAITPKDTLFPTSIEPELNLMTDEPQEFTQDFILPYTGIDEAQDRMVLDVWRWME